MPAAVIEAADSRLSALVPENSELRRLWTGAEWSEGPVYLPQIESVWWSDIPNDRVLEWNERRGVSVHLHPAAFPNGHTLDLRNRVVRCEHGGRRVSRVEPDGTIVTLVDRCGGRRLNSPNDVVVKSDGTIWFTDPPYGIVSDREGHKGESELGGNYVFRFDPHDGSLRVATDELEEPNGLAFSPDESILYVSDSSAALRTDGSGNHHIVAFEVLRDEVLSAGRVFAVIEPGLADGFRIDVQGNLFTSSANGIHVYEPGGDHLGRIAVPEVVSNCVFGGPSRQRLFITATSSLYAIDVAVAGASASDLARSRR